MKREEQTQVLEMLDKDYSIICVILMTKFNSYLRVYMGPHRKDINTKNMCRHT